MSFPSFVVGTLSMGAYLMGGMFAYHLLAIVYHHTQPNQTYQFPNGAGSQVQQSQDLWQDLHQPLLPNVS